MTDLQKILQRLAKASRNPSASRPLVDDFYIARQTLPGFRPDLAENEGTSEAMRVLHARGVMLAVLRAIDFSNAAYPVRGFGAGSLLDMSAAKILHFHMCLGWHESQKESRCLYMVAATGFVLQFIDEHSNRKRLLVDLTSEQIQSLQHEVKAAAIAIDKHLIEKEGATTSESTA